MSCKRKKHSANINMSSLDQFYSDLTTTDTKKKITIGHNIINYLEDDNNSIECDDIGGFIDGLVPWMQSSNFKVNYRRCRVSDYLDFCIWALAES